MAKQFRADKSLIDYLIMIGFTHHFADSSEKYYTNDRGNQVKLNLQTGLITFINKYGHTVDYSSVYISEQISRFSRK